MDLRFVYDAIASVEERFDVDALRLGDINVWLPVRSAMFVSPFTEHRALVSREMLGERALAQPMADERRMPQLSGAEVDVEFRRIGDLSYFRTSSLELPEETDLLFHHDFLEYGDVEDGGCYNRIADNVLELYSDPARCVKVVSARPESLRARFTHAPWQFVEESRGFKSPPAVPGEEALLRQLDAIDVACRNAGVVTAYQPQRLLVRLRQILWLAEQFERLLEVCSPRAVVSSSFARPERMAMTVAARRSGVTSVDVEHGFMGYLSAYGRLGCVPDTGWKNLPDYFWVWGEESARLLRRSLGAAASAHRPIIGGNPDHQRRRHADVPIVGEVSEELRRRKDAADRVALFCWQPNMLVHEEPPRLLPSALQEGISMDRRTLWLIRLHPRSRHLIPKVERHLARIGHGNYEVDLATTDPLPPLIDFADVVLTSYSTVAFEANARRRPVVLIDEVGVAMMEDYVERDVFAAGTDGPSLLAEMERVIGTQTDPVDYIRDDPAIHLDVFRQVLSDREGEGVSGVVPAQ